MIYTNYIMRRNITKTETKYNIDSNSTSENIIVGAI